MNREGNSAPAQETEEVEPELGEMLRSVWRTVRRRKWFILIPFAFITAGASEVSLRMPNRFVSEATVGVVQQQVSQRYVASDAVPINDAVTALRQQILSRASLLKIVEELDLYGDRSQISPEDLILRMQNDLDVQAVEARRDEITALRISFTSQSAGVAQRVTERLTNAFIDENVRQREVQVHSNNSFLDEEVRAAEAKLAAQEARLQSYKTRNLDQLPEQQSSNSLALADLRSRLRLVSPEVERLRRSLRSLESQVADKLAKLQSDRAELLKRYTAQNPAVVKQDAEIAKYSALQEIFGKDGPSSRSRQILATGDDAQVAQLRNQAEEYTNDIDKLTREGHDLEAQIKDYQGRVTAAPLREQEQSAILRDYNLFKADYEALKAKQLQSGLTSNLEQRDQGQRFRLIEPPSFPSRPAGPNRLRIALGAAAGGLVFGLLLAFLRGTVDSTFASEREIAAAFSVPLVLGIPEILTPGERTARTWQSVFDWLAGSVLILCVISTEVYIYLKG